MAIETEHCEQCSLRKGHHSDSVKNDLVVRLNRIEGQIRGVTKMIEQDVYCDDVLNQISSVQAAINGVKKKLLEAHIKSCVIEQITEGRYEVVDELMKTLEKMIK